MSDNDDGPVRFVHDSSFVEAFSNTDHTVLGKRLDPFCLWHKLMLEVVQAKVLTGAKMNPYDLWVAVRICTTPWTVHHGIPNLTAPGKLSFLWQVGRYDFRKEVAKFDMYLRDYGNGPRFWPNQHENKEGGGDRDIDDTLELALHLMREGHLTMREAWTLPIGMANWYSTGLSKLAGNKIDIWTDEHELRFQEHKKIREAKIDKRGAEIAQAEGIPYAEAREKANKEHWDRVQEKRIAMKREPR